MKDVYPYTLIEALSQTPEAKDLYKKRERSIIRGHLNFGEIKYPGFYFLPKQPVN